MNIQTFIEQKQIVIDKLTQEVEQLKLVESEIDDQQLENRVDRYLDVLSSLGSSSFSSYIEDYPLCLAGMSAGAIIELSQRDGFPDLFQEEEQ